MVKIPKLAEDGQNWKIYCAKFLEVAATFDCLEVLAGRPYEGEDWDGCNALLCCMFMETVAPSIYFKIRCRTAHENFKYLAKCFCDNDPIPRANEFQCAGTATVVQMPEKSPMSMNAATERHVNAKSDEEDLSTTKALTQGTQDINGRNAGRTEDPRMSLEASAKGTSAERTDGTIVLCAATPHETQDQLQDSLQMTPRLPTKGKPSECEQEAEESIKMARHTNRTAQSANPPETSANVDRTALPGGDLAERVHIVDEGDGTERKDLRLPKTESFCEERHQRNRNMEDNIPIANGLPLEGEWTVNLSGEASDPKIDGIESEGCKGGMGKPTELLTMSVEPYVENSSDILRVYLRGTWIQMDRSCMQTDAPSALNRPEMVCVSHGEGARTYLGTGDAKCWVDETDSIGSHMDVPSRHGDILSIETKMNTPANAPDTIRIPRKKSKLPDLPMETTRGRPDEPNGCRNHVDGSSARMDAHTAEDKMESAVNKTVNVRKQKTEAQTKHSPSTPEIETLEPTYRWKRVSVGNGGVYVPLDAPIQTASQMFAFGRLERAGEAIAPEVESGGEAIAPVVEGKRVGNDNGDVDSMTSGDNVDSKRVEAVLLAGDSQHMRQS